MLDTFLSSAIDWDHVKALLALRGLSLTAASVEIGRDRSYLTRLHRGELERVAMDDVWRIAGLLRVAVHDLFRHTDPYAGLYAGWHRLDLAHPDLFWQMMRDQAKANCLTSVCADMDSHLIPEGMVLHLLQEDLTREGKTDHTTVERKKERVRRSVAERTALREKEDYVLQVIGRADTPQVIASAKATWAADMRAAMHHYSFETATGFVATPNWDAFYQHILRATPFPRWWKVLIADRLHAMVYFGREVWFTHFNGHVRRLRAAVEEAVARYLHPEFPIDPQPNRGQLARWHHRASDAFKHILDGDTSTIYRQARGRSERLFPYRDGSAA